MIRSRAARLSTALLILALPSAGKAGAQEEPAREVADSARPGLPVSPDSADALRAGMERPPNRHGATLGDALNLPLEIVGLPLRLLSDGVTYLAGLSLDGRLLRPILGAHRALVVAGFHPSITTGPGPRAGPGVAVEYRGWDPLRVETAVSWRGSMRHALGLRLERGAGHLWTGLSFRRQAQSHVWGVGPESPEDARSDFEWDRVSASSVGGLRLDRLVVELSVGAEENAVGPGGDDGVPDLGEVLETAELPGAEDLTRYAFLGADAVLDATGSDTLRLSGLRARLRVDGFEGLSATGGRFVRLEGDVRGYLPLTDLHLLALRVRSAVTREEGGPVPFTHLPSLGGDGGLRAYESGRFRDRDLLTVKGEWRWELWRDLRERGRVEGLLFLERGGVATSLGELSETRSSWGLGMLLFWAGSVRGEAHLAFGEEGSRFSVSLGAGL